MATEEARILIRLGPIENINQELKKIYTSRTIKAIKGKMRPDSYNKMVLDIYSSIAPEESPTSSSSNKGSNQDLPAPTDISSRLWLTNNYNN